MRRTAKAGIQGKGLQARPADRDLGMLWDILQTASFDDINEDVLKRCFKRVDKGVFKGDDALIARCLLSDLYDYLARFDEAGDIVRVEAERILKHFGDDNAPPSVLEITVIVYHAGNLYRRNNFTDAERLLTVCETRCQSVDQKQGTELLAKIAYRRGQVARQEGRFDDALKHFTICIEASLESFRLESTTCKTGDESRQKYLYACHSVGKVLIMGAGWMYFNRGQLRNARPLLLSGKVLAENAKDSLLKSFGDMILGCIERSEGGTDPARLEKAIPQLRRAHDTFKGRNERYQAVAAYYLAIALLYKGELKEAGEYAAAIRKYRPNDLRWEANADVVMSRIARAHYEKDNSNSQFLSQAIGFANEAIAKARRGTHLLPLLDGTIALGEAELMQGDKDLARRRFQDALEISRKIENPKATGACYLHLARLYATDQNIASARAQLNRWRELAPFIENGLLKSWAYDIERTMEEMKADFRIPVDSEESALQYSANIKRLQLFLYRLALDKANGDKQKAAKILGVSRQAIYKWTEPGKYGSAHPDPS